MEGHPTLQKVFVHPGGGLHKGKYYKLSTANRGVIKVVDPATYKATTNDKATIISGAIKGVAIKGVVAI